MANKNSTLLITLVLVVMLAGGFLVFRANQSLPKTDDVVPSPSHMEPELNPKGVVPDNDEMPKTVQGTENYIKLDSNTISGPLTDVTGGDSTGTAYTLRKDGQLLHFVEAELPEPAEGSVYEGWLVNQTPLAFFSTGVMNKNKTGTYTLLFTSNETHPKFNHVVITEETVVDETPEKHIIEGTIL